MILDLFPSRNIVHVIVRVHLFLCVFNINFIQLSYFLSKLKKKPKSVIAINVEFLRQTLKALRRKPHIKLILHILNGTVLQRTHINIYTSSFFFFFLQKLEACTDIPYFL